MTIQRDIEILETRLAQAEVERDAWQAAGRQERYLEAYVKVQALQLQLDQQRHRRGLEERR
jgi:hypothetical protein